MNNKHFMIYYKKGTGTYVITEPRPWARENLHLFIGVPLQDGAPRTKTIEDYLIDKHKFKIEEYNDENVTVLINLDPLIDL